MVDCYSDGMDISHTGDENLVKEWLVGIFGRAFDPITEHIALRAGGGQYSVKFQRQAVQAGIKQLTFYPLWRDVAYLSEGAQNQVLSEPMQLPSDFIEGPQLVSFHSFKGGVGRTTAMMTYVAARLQATGNAVTKLLVVDADLEAPGVSFWLDDINRPQVSFVQFLEAMHYPPVSSEASLDFFTEELRKSSLNVDGAYRELFVLPAALDLAEILDMPVQPSHLARNPSNPWILTDHLHALGKRLGVDAVFIDLRAGLSELSSPLIFDPRIEHYFVTTVAKQSVVGMAEVLKRLHTLHGRLSAEKQRDVKPSVILSLLTTELKKLPEYEYAIERIEEAYAPTDSTLTEGVEWLEADFAAPLMSISTLREALEKLQSSSLYQRAQAWAARPLTATPNITDVLAGSNPKSEVQALYEICDAVQFAEKNESKSLLVTEPLRNLGKHFSIDIPNVVLAGAKGAGKTFTFLQVCRALTWDQFLERVGEFQGASLHKGLIRSSPDSLAERSIFPVLWSQNLEVDAKNAMSSAQTGCLRLLEVGIEPIKQTVVLRDIDENLKNPPFHWDHFWAELICRYFGVAGNNLDALNKKLVELNRSIVLVFDGIEDAFPEPSNNEQQQKAIESLLKLTNRLSELDQQRIGALIFVRADYVQAAIKQNQGQFLARYAPFQLTWNPESFLRLAYWLCAQAKIIDASQQKAVTMTVTELIKALEQLWGRKLGRANSKEALSARWVYSALCDLKGNFQARDLVRFFKFATDQERKKPTDPSLDRLLAPESIRRAIPDCSTEKVKEAIAEIAPLKEWSSRMITNNITDRQIPFSAASMHLQPSELAALSELGVIYEDLDTKLGDQRLFLPEIYRKGLGFDSSSGRPKIQALLKKNLGSMPF